MNSDSIASSRWRNRKLRSTRARISDGRSTGRRSHMGVAERSKTCSKRSEAWSCLKCREPESWRSDRILFLLGTQPWLAPRPGRTQWWAYVVEDHKGALLRFVRPSEADRASPLKGLEVHGVGVTCRPGPEKPLLFPLSEANVHPVGAGPRVEDVSEIENCPAHTPQLGVSGTPADHFIRTSESGSPFYCGSKRSQPVTYREVRARWPRSPPVSRRALSTRRYRHLSNRTMARSSYIPGSGSHLQG